MSNKKNREIYYKGLAVNSGIVLANVCFYSDKQQNHINEITIENDEVNDNLKRLTELIKVCTLQLDDLYTHAANNIGKAESEIFTAQIHILNDPIIINSIKQEIIKNRKILEWAIDSVYLTYEKKLQKLGNLYMRDRTNDIHEIKQMMLNNIFDNMTGFHCEGQSHCTHGNNKIIVANVLTAKMMVHMDLNRVLGIVTEHGGISSHAAIIARSVGIPSVTGVRNIFSDISCGTQILVDGDTGTVIVNPSKKTIKKLIPTEMVAHDRLCVLSSPAGTNIYANASIIEDVYNAKNVRADGIGLLRTEIFFMRSQHMVTEDEQFDFYNDVCNIMEDKPVTFRLLDIGGDKELPFLDIVKETNPYLGFRGSRFILENREILAPQVRAILRLSATRMVKILFPMVIDTAQLEKLITVVRELIPTVVSDPQNIKLGAMFEVPSACLMADSIIDKCDFASIGSNDLIQYLFAVDRNNEMVSQDYDPYHPVLWKVLENLGNTAKLAGKQLSICGEMAGRAGVPKRLIDIGITSLSVSPRLIPRVRTEVAK